ncbi:unnamed protein product [Trifolium pratense]|uniref:Uncharacterized protein n=1 Tax=Trifolium pratense TaxID=57577 RepID=A0ACB0LY58_TRIPR|nr:unnamed protein product [Trifolium pratense]
MSQQLCKIWDTLHSGISYMFDQMESLGDDDLTSLYSTSVQQILSIEDVTAEFISLNCQWNVPTILQSFGCIAQWSVSDLGSQVEEITSYICQKIIQMECLDNDDNDLTSLNGTSQCSKSCQLKEKVVESQGCGVTLFPAYRMALEFQRKQLICYMSYFKTVLAGIEEPVSDSTRIAEKILMELFEIDEENVSCAAKFGWYKELVDCIIQVFKNLNGLVKLAGVHANKGIIAAYGGVPLVLYLMFSSRKPAFITIKCFEILEKLSSDDDEINFFIDGEGKQLELDNIITDLLALQQLPNSGHYFRKPALRALLGICKFETGLVKNAILAANGVSQILPLLDDSDSEIRETAICLLFLFSQHEPGVVGYLFRPRRLKS